MKWPSVVLHISAVAMQVISSLQYPILLIGFLFYSYLLKSLLILLCKDLLDWLSLPIILTWTTIPLGHLDFDKSL